MIRAATSRLLLLTALAAAPLQAPLVAQTTPAVPRVEGTSRARFRNLTTLLDDYVAQGALAGGVLRVQRHGQVVYEHAFGMRDRETKDSMRPDAIFRIASQTKALVSVGIMMLQEEGKLLIDQPLSRYLPEWEKTTVAVAKSGGGYDVVPAKRRITLRDLLTHTAGIGYGYGPASDQWKAAGIQGWYFADRDETVAAVVKRMAALPMDAQPGTAFVYGYNTDILGAVIEAVSGQTLADFLKARLFVPLRMTSTAFYVDPANRGRFATVYTAVNGKLEPSPTPGAMTGQGAYVDGPRIAFSGGAGITSTAGDYARFLQMMLNGGELLGTRILSPTTVKLMTVNHAGTLYGSDGFGLGFSIKQNLGTSGLPGSIGEYGWGGAYHSTYWVDPQEDMVVTYMTNLNDTGGVDDHQRIRALIYAAIVGR
ncbi:MAG: beta-lactamase family protein [Gemmatimonadetes bacterium]|nr:beta-lactamase family protein [Gemmatimonadota bacterium]